MVARARVILAILGAAFLSVGCDIVASTPFPEFLGYTDISVDLSSRIDDIWDDRGEIDYQLDVVYSTGNPARVLLVVEPPTDAGGTFDYRGRLMLFDEDLTLITTLQPVTDLDFFSRPFAYTHAPDATDSVGVILLSTMFVQPDGYLYDASLSFLGLEGPAIADQDTPPENGSTYVFSAPPGEFSTFEISWQAYGAGLQVDRADDPDTIYAIGSGPADSGSFAIVPSSDQSGDAGFQILDAIYNEATDEVTFLLSEPTAERVVAARTTLAEITGGSISSLASGSGGFPIEVPADRPLDYHVDEDGFFLRRRDGLLERYNWTPTGTLRQTGSETLTGDRYFFRQYAFLSGDSPSGSEYMYRFDPSSRILTRYKKWW